MKNGDMHECKRIAAALDSAFGSAEPKVAAPVRGFTLIELMIVVAIITILSLVAFPAYQDSVWKSRRGEAKAAIFRGLQSQERYYTSNNRYVKVPSDDAAGFAMPVFSGDSLEKSTYTITADHCLNETIDQCVVVTATTIAKADPKCGNSLSMTSKGKKDSASDNSACW